MGGSFAQGDFVRAPGPSLQNLYQDSGQIFVQGGAYFASMFGKGLGGGTLVNSGISFKPPAKALQRWSAEAGDQTLNETDFKKYVDEVEANVNIEVLDLDRLGENNLIFKKGVERLGYRGGVIPRSTKNCVGCGICYFGCPSGAKQSTDKNFLITAQEKGAEIYVHARVEKIVVDPKSRKFTSVVGVITDPKPGGRRSRFEIKARNLVLGAGTVGNVRLLLGNNLCNSSDQVGRNFHCHPSTGVLGVFNQKIEGFRSVMQGYFSDQFFDQDLLLETFWAPPGALALMAPGIGTESFAEMKRFPQMAGSGAMIRDESEGRIKVDDTGAVCIDYELTQRDQKLLTKGLYECARVMFAAGAEKVFADNMEQSVLQNIAELNALEKRVENLGPDIVREGNHGTGTCRMGADPRKSVVNAFGQSHDISNIWILDGSIFPSALGVNPQITIMALALRGAEALHGSFF
jgi:choline dehydrogenase-like flavoprotein